MNRRTFLSAAAGSLFFTQKGIFAEELTLTPAQTEGPFYPDHLPLDQDNDLIHVTDHITPAIGQIARLSGRILTRSGSPVRNAVIEIWQADANGCYIHSRSPNRNRDANFQGYGKFETGSTGEYMFRTVKPGLYPGRTPHVHAIVAVPGGRKLTTQVYVQGDPHNDRDGVLRGIRDARQREAVIVPWTPIGDSSVGELAAKWDIVLGFTPGESV